VTERETLLAEIAERQARLAELDAKPDWLPCAHCGGEVDPQGWFNSVGERGPECDRCGVTAPDKAAWNQRAAPPMGKCQPRWPSEAELREMWKSSLTLQDFADRIRAYQTEDQP
jgi:hypothetical protein